MRPPHAFSPVTASSVVGVEARSDVYHIEAASGESAGHKVAHHTSRKTCVASDYYSTALFGGVLRDEFGKSGSKLHNIERSKAVAGRAADSAAYT